LLWKHRPTNSAAFWEGGNKGEDRKPFQKKDEVMKVINIIDNHKLCGEG